MSCKHLNYSSETLKQTVRDPSVHLAVARLATRRGRKRDDEEEGAALWKETIETDRGSTKECRVKAIIEFDYLAVRPAVDTLCC